jgi:outer membrane protein OmpA-like peptidoglycan-associated protein
MSHSFARACAVGLCLTLAGRADAQSAGSVERGDVHAWTLEVEGTEREGLPATPTYGGDTGLFQLPSAYTLPRGGFSFSGFRNNLDRDPKDEDISIHGVTLAFGITSRVEFFGSVGIQNRINADALNQPGFVNDFPFVNTSWQTGFGDVWLGLKLNLQDDQTHDAIGLAIRGFVKIPTASEGNGLGTGKVSGGGDLVLSKWLGHVVGLHGLVGFQANGDPQIVHVGNAFKWGVGLNLPTGRRVQLQAELTGASYSGADSPQTKPADLVVGPVVWLGRGFFVRPAVSWNLNFNARGAGSGVSTYTGRQVSIGYHPGTAGRVVVQPARAAAPPPPTGNRPPTVTCQWDKAVVRAGEQARIRAQASDPDGDRLDYAWSTEQGRLTAQGPEAVLDSAGLTAPTSVAVTVRVSDGRGASAQAVCQGRLEAPQEPESVTCTSAGFPRNGARLNNVDKACLDDVAARLRRDLRSRVTITGHAEPGERYPQVLSRRRAEAAKSYLVNERGVDESRITGQGSEAGAGGRRVEIELVTTQAPPR